MNNKIIITFVCASSILLLSFKENVQKISIDSNGVKNMTLSSIEESFQDTSYFKNPQTVILETLDKSLLTGIKRIFMDDNKLFIYDNKEENIFIFDTSGKYLSKIDCKGEGPREYIEISDFTIDNSKKQIILLCAIPEKRMYFTYDGKFVKEEKHTDFYSQLTTDGNFIYFEERIIETKDYQLHILDTKTGKKQNGLKPINIKNYFYTKGNSLSRGKDILFVRRYDNSIYELKNGEIIEKFHVDFKKHSFPDRLKEEEKTEVVIKECDTNEYIFSMSNVINNNSYMMFSTNRAIFIYDKKSEVLTGYKQILNSKFSPIFRESFIYYLPLENTDKIVCYIEDPSFIKQIVKKMAEHPDNIKIKEMKDKHPDLIKEIINIESKITEDSNPLLFIYEFKN